MIDLPSLDIQNWELGNAEHSHKNAPETFWIPDQEVRRNLKRGDAAKLLFQIGFLDENDKPYIQVERMWVIVSEVIGNFYIGILDSKPATIVPDDDEYLVFGAEIPFRAEHVSDVSRPPDEYIEWQLQQVPERIWER